MTKTRFRASENLFQCDPDLPPTANLAAAIIHRAVCDCRRLRAGRPLSATEGFVCNEKELRQFFTSRWCATLLGFADISTDRFLQEVENDSERT